MRTEDRPLEELLKRTETNPVEARERLKTFMQCVDKGDPVPNKIMEYLAEGFRTYLLLDATRNVWGYQTLDSALGLLNKPGEKRSTLNRDVFIAKTVFGVRMSGSTYAKAVENAQMRFRPLSERVIQECFSKHRAEAGKLYLEDRRLKNAEQLNAEQEARFYHILGK